MNTELKFIFFLIGLFFISCTNAVCQTPVYKNYTVADGLPSQTVYSVMQDKKGYIWITTDAGVSRFDGVHFTNFTTNDGLADNEIFYTFEDSYGRLWFTTFNGKPCYFYNEKFFNPGNDTVLKKIKTSGPLQSIYEDSRHNIWFGTSNSSISYITAGQEVINISLPSSVPSAYVYFYEPEKNEMYVVFGDRFYSYNNGSFNEVKFPPLSANYDLAFCNISENKAVYISEHGIELLSGKQITHLTGDPKAVYLNGTVTIYCDKHNENIWLTRYQKGTVLFQKDENGNYRITRTLLKEKQIIRVYSDKENNKWFASSGNGVYKLSSENFNLKSFTAQDGLEQSPVNCIKIDSKKNIWVGHNNGFISCIDNESKIRKFDCSLNKKSYIRVVGIELDKQNNIWVGTDNGVITFKSPIENNFGNARFIPFDSLASFPFKAFAVDKHDNLTITYSHGVGKLSKKGEREFFSVYNKAIPYERTYTHFFDHGDNLWISNINGLSLLKNDSLIYYELPDKTPIPRVSSIAESKDSILILATYGFGVLFFKNGKVINRFTEADGLVGNICKKIFICSDTVYVASVGGLSRFVYRNNVISAIKKFTVSDGLLSTSVNDVVVDGETIYIATTEGVSILPVNLQNLQSAAPWVYITSLKVNGVPADTSRRINLSYQNQYLQLNFIAPVFDRPENTVYSYNISGHGTQWTETKNTAVEFSLLEPGAYTFMVRAKKDGSAWSEPAQLKFYIASPYWKTGWFRLTAILLSFFIVYLIVYFRINRVKKAANEKTELNRKIAGLEMKALRAQMNPHFTFNVMNSIQNYIINNDSTSALRYLSKFAKLIRITLDNSQSPVIKLSEELTALEIYLELEKMRFKEKLEYEISTGSDVDTSAIFIPSMLLQPYVENAIKHGIMDKKENGKVFVGINKNESTICCVIEDNGVGRQKAAAIKNADNGNQHVSMGSQIALHRVEAYNIANNSNIVVNVEDLKNEQNEAAGTRVLIYIPVK